MLTALLLSLSLSTAPEAVENHSHNDNKLPNNFVEVETEESRILKSSYDVRILKSSYDVRILKSSYDVRI